MAIRVQEKDNTRNGAENADGFTYKRVYQVKSDTALDEFQALTAVDTVTAVTVPKVGEKHPGHSRAVVTERSVTDEDAGKVWSIDVSYATPEGEGPHDEDDEDSDPCSQRAVVKFGSAPYSKVIFRAYQAGDTQGNPSKPILNSANDPFDPPLQDEVSRPVISIKYNLRRFSPGLKFQLENTINSEETLCVKLHIPAKWGRLLAIACDPMYDAEDELYWAMEVQIEINSDTYTRKLLDQGFYYMDGATKKEITAKDKAGADVAVTEPQKLNGTGGIGTTPAFLSFETFWPASWKPLNLPRTY